ncbi:uncharacterized protein LOC121417257 [Lytechinus variegatus]|uniref:uncharacterized protein LOC121417257 n=1 Tax=Lytechinus variegatus TaxID=7654 RepID=UPI001BB11A7C|nr:uncharacterized protein LOC121417257 [Lytechinus variegatus]
MECSWLKWILIFELMLAFTSKSAIAAEDSYSGVFECYACSSMDTVECGAEFNGNAEGVFKIECRGLCYKTTYGYLGERVIDRGCEPSTDCPSSCFNKDCRFCCQDSLCNKARIVTSFPILTVVLVGLATLTNILRD